MSDQLQRTGLWTDQSLIVLLQKHPLEALAARSPAISNRTQSLGPAQLSALGQAMATGHAAEALNQALAALSADLDAENLSLLGVWTFGPCNTRDALFHICVLWAIGLFGSLLIWFESQQSLLPPPVMNRTMRLGHRRDPTRDLEYGDLLSGADILVCRQSRTSRPRTLMFGLSLSVGIAAYLFLEPAFGGLTSFWENQQLWLFADSWAARAALNIGLMTCCYLLLLLSPLGAWISPKPWCHARLEHDLTYRL